MVGWIWWPFDRIIPTPLATHDYGRRQITTFSASVLELYNGPDGTTVDFGSRYKLPILAVKAGHLEKKWRKTSWRLWDDRTEEDTASFVDSEDNKWVGPQQSWSKEGTIEDRQSKEASILWSHHEETRELPGERDNARNNARCIQARRPRTAWMDNIKTWTRLTMEESVRIAAEDRDKWRKYVYGVANPRIEDG